MPLFASLLERAVLEHEDYRLRAYVFERPHDKPVVLVTREDRASKTALGAEPLPIALHEYPAYTGLFMQLPADLSARKPHSDNEHRDLLILAGILAPLPIEPRPQVEKPERWLEL